MSRKEFAAAEKVSLSLVRRWLALGMPVEPDGKIDPVAARAWLSANTERTTDSTESLTQARARGASLLADLRAIELRKLRGELIDVSVAAEEQARGDKIVAEALLSIPDRLSQRLAGMPARQIREALMVELRTALQRSSDAVARV